MKYDALETKAAPLPFFDESLLRLFGGSKEANRLNLTRWVKGGKIIRLKRGLYTLPDDRRKIRFSPMGLANALYSPSYLSLEFALSWYDMIPERVSAMTSVSRLKTAKFSNPMGV
ncbi:MAG: type IV toxin-antitoxin system AbiEi family antitoxin domain-containing protein, partial [Deltaproteobacteria bacterium]|nr:type IV toxin-antitoxin system AbiEi family antitoxin domain-containing protein [Deltaproteobacteria bacterium]